MDYLLQFVFRRGRRHSEDVVQFRVYNIGHGDAVDVASAERRADKEKEPVENVLLDSASVSGRDRGSLRPLLPPSGW